MMIFTKLKPLMLHMMLVAGTGAPGGQPIDADLVDDLRVVLTALQRSNPNDLEVPDGTLDTHLSAAEFMHHNMDRIEQALAEFSELDLTGMNLRQLPAQGIMMMVKLKTLILDNNNGLELTPEDIRMISLSPTEKISIRNSNISFETFTTLWRLPYLSKLDISGNESLSTCTANDKLGSLTVKLKELNVSGCGLGGNWLDDILKCTNLNLLNVSKNPKLFENKLPSATYSFMKGLDTLNVSSCSLDNAWLREIPECTKLVDLDISYNAGIGRNDENFENFVKLKSLTRLNACQCDLVANSLTKICKSGALDELNLNSNQFLWEYDKDEVDFGACRQSIRVLKLGFTDLTEDGLRALCGLPSKEGQKSSILRSNEDDCFPKLAILDISCDHVLASLISQGDFSFGHLMKTLTELNVSGVNIKSNNAFRVLEKCENLIRLNLSGNTEIWKDTSSPLNFGQLKTRLQVLNVGSTRLPLTVLSKIFEFDQLIELRMHANTVFSKDLNIKNFVLGGMKNTLQRIDVRGTRITIEVLQWIFDEFNLLEKVDARENGYNIKPADLLGLKLDSLKDRLAEFIIPTDDLAVAAELRRRLPKTIISSART